MSRMSRFAQMRYFPLIKAVLDQAGAPVGPDEWDVHSNGSAHIVVNAGHRLSVRVAKNLTAGEAMETRTRLLRALPDDLPFAVPRPLTRVISRAGYTAVGLSWIPGEARDIGPAPARQLGRALRAIGGMDPVPLERYLEPVHHHWGGDNWEKTLREQVVPRLLPGNRHVAERLIEEVLEMEPVEPRIIHSDFSGHNILWNKDKLTGVIDWDHAALGDPSWDIAAAANWYGWDVLTKCVGKDWAERAKTVYHLMPLQSVGYAIVNGGGGAITRQSLERADAWFEEHRGELPA